MSVNSFRKPLVVAASALALSGAGVGAAQAASSSSATTSAEGHRGPTAAQRTALAEELGVTVAQLDAALAAIRPETATTG